MTDAERRLWQALHGRQLRNHEFRRQHPFRDYILDFVRLDAMLVVEVDGGQHVESREADELRSKDLQRAGFRVLRFWNNRVLHELGAVTEQILNELARAPSPPRPSP
jgi:very-short-patch-repair endonuclease